MNKQFRQGGAALVVTLVLLVMALLLGISSFQSSRMEEGMAGNYRASSAAFMAAEYGGSELWENFLVSANRSSLCDGVLPADDGFTTIVIDGQDTQLDLRYHYACSPEFDEDTKESKFGRYRLVSTGRVVQEVPVDRHILYAARLGIGPGAPLVAADVEGDCKSTIDLPSSRAEFVGDEDVDGNFRAALQVGCDWLAKDAAESVLRGQQKYVVDGETYTCAPGESGNRLCNYKGGIQGGIDIEILKNPGLLAEFLTALRYDNPAEKILNPDYSTPPSEVTVINSFPTMVEGVYFLEPSEAHARDAKGRANFVEAGNFSGSGILVIDGNVNFKGVPNFEGLIIVLGDYVVDGGGGAQQGTFRGSVVAAPLDWDHKEYDEEGVLLKNYVVEGGNEYFCEDGTCEFVFAPKTLDIGGGGSSPYIFDGEALLSAFGLVENITLDDGRNITDLWGVDGVNLGDRYYISEWQEIFDIDDAGMGGGG